VLCWYSQHNTLTRRLPDHQQTPTDSHDDQLANSSPVFRFFHHGIFVAAMSEHIDYRPDWLFSGCPLNRRTNFVYHFISGERGYATPGGIPAPASWLPKRHRPDMLPKHPNGIRAITRNLAGDYLRQSVVIRSATGAPKTTAIKNRISHIETPVKGLSVVCGCEPPGIRSPLCQFSKFGFAGKSGIVDWYTNLPAVNRLHYVARR
jgi:hypothetical protein